MCRNWRPFWLFSLCRRILGSKTKFELCRRIVWFSVKTHFVDAILRFYTLSTQFSVFKLCRRNSKCFSEEMRRQSEILSKCVDKVIFWRNASTKWNSVYFEKTREKCVDKVIFDKIKEQCVDKVETPFLGFKNCTSKMAKNRDICTQKKKNGHIRVWSTCPVVDWSWAVLLLVRRGAIPIYSELSHINKCPFILGYTAPDHPILVFLE